MLNLFHKPSQKKNLVKHVTDTLGITICVNDELSQLMCRCRERKLMKFIEFRDSVQDFLTRIKSNISIKRCNTSTEEPKKKRMSTDTGNIIHMQSLLDIRTGNCLSKRHQRMSPTCRVNSQHRTVMLLIFKM